MCVFGAVVAVAIASCFIRCGNTMPILANVHLDARKNGIVELGASDTCADCGPCGLMGGANTTNVLHYSALLDDNQSLVVGLFAGATGECGATHSFWLDSSGMVRPRPSGAKPDYTTPNYDGSNGYSHNGQSVQMVREGHAGVRVTFMGGQTLTCATADGRTVACK